MNVIEHVAAAFCVSPEDVIGRSRFARITLPRFAAAYILRHRFKLSYPAIARMLDRDHSTIVCGEHRAIDLLGTDPTFAAVVERIMAMPNDVLRAPPELRPSARQLQRAATLAKKHARYRERVAKLRKQGLSQLHILQTRDVDLPTRKVKHKNAIAEGETDSMMRFRGTLGLLEAIALHHPERLAA